MLFVFKAYDVAVDLRYAGWLSKLFAKLRGKQTDMLETQGNHLFPATVRTIVPDKLGKDWTIFELLNNFDRSQFTSRGDANQKI